jgi:hypothetical protein
MKKKILFYFTSHNEQGYNFCLSIGIFNQLTEKFIEYIINSLRECLSNNSDSLFFKLNKFRSNLSEIIESDNKLNQCLRIPRFMVHGLLHNELYETY